MDFKKIIESLGENKDEVLKKVAQCKSAEELLQLAKENGIVLDEVGAAEIFQSMQVKTGELSDEELDAAAGGGDKPRYIRSRCNRCGYYDTNDKFMYHSIGMMKCPKCGSESLTPCN